MQEWEKAYHYWCSSQQLDHSLKKELERMKDDPAALEDAFYKELAFGTGGMRGIIGPGTNRMNLYTIRKAVHGMAKYLLKYCVNVKDRGVVVAYDPRHMSREFAVETAKVLGFFGIKTYVFNKLKPTPLLSYAVRYLGTAAGVMITASHNPPEYNGFKVYNEDGGQFIPEEANKIIDEIRKINDELNIPVLDLEELEKKDLIIWIDNEVDNAYLDQLMQMTKLPADALKAPKDLQIVFTPLHGTAHDLVLKGLEQLHFTDVAVVKEQAIPDPEFSTVTSPNPEEHQAFQMAVELAEEKNADILLGTDPDADRLGVAVKNRQGEYTVLTGNQLGSLFIDYILSHADPVVTKNARVLKTIVTTELGRAIASSYGVKTIDTLTGFKYIAEKIREFDETGETFMFGFEESYGYLLSSFTRDKDAVQSAVMACEMAYYWKQQGKTLLDALDVLYEKYGCYLEKTTSITLTGKEGSEKIQAIMETFRKHPLREIAGMEVEQIEDYLAGERTITANHDKKAIELPKENVLKFILSGNNWICLRPSGTEPKIKCYYGVYGNHREESEQLLLSLQEKMGLLLKEIIDTHS